jgi:8-oxo-dGTP diphosphatase
MKREYPDRPIVGVGAVIVRDSQVVLVQRGREPLKGRWTIPGGVVELGETVRECAMREAREETGLLVEAEQVLEVVDSIVPDPDGRMQYHFVLVDFFCRPQGGELQAGGDAVDARWVNASDLDRFQLTEAAARIIHKALEQNKAAVRK